MAQRLRAPLAARFSSVVLRSALVLELAAGADPCARAALELRAARLCRARSRRAIARRLRRIVVSGYDAGSPLARSEILEESNALIDLALRLEAPEPVEPMGVALAKVVAAGGPLPLGVTPGTLHTLVGLARASLEGPR